MAKSKRARSRRRRAATRQRVPATKLRRRRSQVMHLQGAGDAALERQRKIAPGLQGNQQSEGDRAVEDQAGHVKRRLWPSRCLVIPASLAWNSVVPRLLSQYAVASNGSTWENQRIFMLLATRMPTVTAIQFTQERFEAPDQVLFCASPSCSGVPKPLYKSMRWGETTHSSGENPSFHTSRRHWLTTSSVGGVASNLK